MDIDGTLVSHTISDIPEGVLEAFSQIQKKGILLLRRVDKHPAERYPDTHRSGCQ
ncbi:MAG: hypothetical protein IJP92_16345 [Lachnospiraceae bacterium]|nr:hypothetical protein [Lachnospiraceae bacterium]